AAVFDYQNRGYYRLIALIEIEAVLDEAGLLRSCRAAGHARAGKAGTDIVCAAVSVLIRTAVHTLSNREGISVRGDAPEPGLLWLEADCSAEGREFLSAAGAFLLNGLGSVAEEFPEFCKLTFRTEGRT
ncbi:MAG: ribosomal-processing cysteine protease Prp, partial [Treponema sp.]|nr:ribosomal-processing cysteine protease Prp [Treponema sp.]